MKQHSEHANGVRGCLLGAAALALVGTALLQWGRVERRLAEAAEHLATSSYADAGDSLADADRILGYLAYVPPFGRPLASEIRLRRAELRYWQRDYDAIIPAEADPVAAVARQRVELQFVVANAVFRQALGRAQTPVARLNAFDTGIAAQLEVLKNAPRHEDAAFNYEYLLRLRAAEADDPLLGRPDEDGGTEKSMHGQPGGAPRRSEPTEFKIHIPLESKEFENQMDGERAGKVAPRDRRG